MHALRSIRLIGPGAAIGSRQLHEAWMDHYVTQAASKAKPNGGIA